MGRTRELGRYMNRVMSNSDEWALCLMPCSIKLAAHKDMVKTMHCVNEFFELCPATVD